MIVVTVQSLFHRSNNPPTWNGPSLHLLVRLQCLCTICTHQQTSSYIRCLVDFICYFLKVFPLLSYLVLQHHVSQQGVHHKKKNFGSFIYLQWSLSAVAFTLSHSTIKDWLVKSPFKALMVTEVGVPVIPSFLTIFFVANVPWLQFSSKA